MRRFLSNLFRQFGTRRSAKVSPSNRWRAQLGVESLDERVLLSTAGFVQRPLVYNLQSVLRPTFVIPASLANHSVELYDGSGNDLGGLVIQTVNTNGTLSGTFTGTFDGYQINPGLISATGISFTADWLTGNTPIPHVSQFEHVSYNGSLSHFGSVYSTSGTLTQNSYLGYIADGVVTVLSADPPQPSQAHGVFA
jgi:hypothetical protein